MSIFRFVNLLDSINLLSTSKYKPNGRDHPNPLFRQEIQHHYHLLCIFAERTILLPLGAGVGRKPTKQKCTRGNKIQLETPNANFAL